MKRLILLAAVLWLGASTLALVAAASKTRKSIGIFDAGVTHSEGTDR
jgi:hypothetical protein